MTSRPDAGEDHHRIRVGAGLRALGHAFVGHHADAELLDETAAALESLTERLSAGAPRSRDAIDWRERKDLGPAPDGERMHTYDDRPFSGRSSPWGLGLEVHRRGDEIEAMVTLDAAHEGAPERSHGGIVAGLFDDIFGFVLDILQQPAFTGELTIRYEAPTPLHRPLACRGRLRERVGRKIFIEGELVDLTGGADGNEHVVARGTGLFIAVDLDAMSPTARLPAPPDEG